MRFLQRVTGEVDKFIKGFSKSLPNDSQVNHKYNYGWEAMSNGLFNLNSNSVYDQSWIDQTCINLISSVANSLPIQLEDSNGNIVPNRENIVATKLLIKPNESETPNDFFTRLYSDYLITGNSYIYRVGDNLEKPISLHTLFSSVTRAVISNQYQSSADSYYTINPTSDGNGRIQALPEYVIHNKTFNQYSKIMGVSPLLVTANKSSTLLQIEQMGINSFKNGIHPGVVFTTDLKLQDHEFEAAKDKINEQYAGIQNTKKTIFADAGLRPMNLSYSPVELDLAVREGMTAGHIATARGVPGELLGAIMAAKNRATYEQAMKQFIMLTVLPLIRIILGNINCHFFPNGDYLFEVPENKLRVLQSSIEDLSKAWWLTPNRKRVLMGEKPLDLPGMDEIILPSGFITLDELYYSNNEL